MSLDAHDVAFSSAQDRSVDPLLQHPNDVELQGTLKENVWRLLEAEDPENTRKAYEPKMKEYFEFCCSQPSTRILLPGRSKRRATPCIWAPAPAMLSSSLDAKSLPKSHHEATAG